MINQKNIATIINILKKESKRFKSPIVTQVSKKINDPFKVLISCLLSQRTRDETTAKACERLFRLAKTPKQMMKLSIKQIQDAIYPVGFYKTKARRIKELCRTLVKKYHSKVPDLIDELMKLKGIGRKTANIVLVFGYNKNAIPVDVHVHVIANRLGWISTKNPEETELELRKIIPLKYWMKINNLFVMHGQNICHTKKPKCGICPINRYCSFFSQ